MPHRQPGLGWMGLMPRMPSLPVASLDMASGSSQVPVKEPIVGKSHKYEVNDLVSSFFLLLLLASSGKLL